MIRVFSFWIKPNYMPAVIFLAAQIGTPSPGTSASGFWVIKSPTDLPAFAAISRMPFIALFIPVGSRVSITLSASAWIKSLTKIQKASRIMNITSERSVQNMSFRLINKN